MKIYIAGPMTGHADYNFPAFHTAAAAWRAKGWEVVSPAELDNDHDPVTDPRPWDYYLRRDIAILTTCDAIALLPGWSNSNGARLEHTVAEALGMTKYFAVLPEEPPNGR